MRQRAVVCNMNEIRVSSLKPDHKSSFLKVYENVYSSKEEVEAFYGSFLENGWISTAWKNSELAGVLTWMPREAAKHGLAEIIDLWVSPEERRKGVGERLLEHAIAQMRQYYQHFNSNLRKVMLFTGASDKYHAARRLYEKKGFRIVTTIPINTLGNTQYVEFLYVLQLHDNSSPRGL